MNRDRRFLLLLLGVILLLSSLAAACGEPQKTSHYSHYVNEEYGYGLDYPSNWNVDASEAHLVFIDPPISCSQLLRVTIAAFDSESDVPIDITIRQWVEVLAGTWENFILLSSQPLEDNWDWLVEYTYNIDGLRVRSQNYIKQTNHFGYIVDLTYESDSVPVEMQDILESFTTSG